MSRSSDATTPDSKTRRVDSGHPMDELLRLTMSREAPVVDIAALVRDVPGLEAAVCAAANSAALNLPTRIASLEHAIVYLGLQRVRRIAEHRLEGAHSRWSPHVARHQPTS